MLERWNNFSKIPFQFNAELISWSWSTLGNSYKAIWHSSFHLAISWVLNCGVFFFCRFLWTLSRMMKMHSSIVHRCCIACSLLFDCKFIEIWMSIKGQKRNPFTKYIQHGLSKTFTPFIFLQQTLPAVERNRSPALEQEITQPIDKYIYI